MKKYKYIKGGAEDHESTSANSNNTEIISSNLKKFKKIITEKQKEEEIKKQKEEEEEKIKKQKEEEEEKIKKQKEEEEKNKKLLIFYSTLYKNNLLKNKEKLINIIPGIQYKKILFLNNVDKYFNIDNIYSKHYKLFKYLNKDYINDIIDKLKEIKKDIVINKSKFDFLSNSRIISKSRSRSRSSSTSSNSKSRSRTSIKGGSNLYDNGINFLKCLSIFDAKHDFTKKNNTSELAKYINNLGIKTIDENFRQLQNNNEIKTLFTSNTNYEADILKFIIININSILSNNIDINNFSIININSDNLITTINNNSITLSSDTIGELINYTKNFFNYSNKNTENKSYIFDTSLKIDTNIKKIIKDNIFSDSDSDNDSDSDSDTDDNNKHQTSAIKNNLFDKLGKHIKPFENAFDPHSSNDIVINDIETYNLYYQILNDNFNYSISTPAITFPDYLYPIKEITRKFFKFHIYPFIFINNLNYYNPCFELITCNNQFLKNHVINKIKRYIDTTSFIDIDVNNNYKIKSNIHENLIIKDTRLFIQYKKSFNTINLLNSVINLLIKINNTSITKKNDIQGYIDNSNFCDNNVLNILTIYLFITHEQTTTIENIINNVINILLDLKKAGDWGQSLFCSKLNNIKSNNNCFFISGDQLSATRSILSGNVNTMFATNNNLALFKSNNINTFKDLHTFINENIYNHEIFKFVFDLNINDTSKKNILFYSITILLQPHDENTIITSTNINFKFLKCLLYILKDIFKIYINYNSVIRHNHSDNKMIKNNISYLRNINSWIEKFNDIDIFLSIQYNKRIELHIPNFNSIYNSDIHDYKIIFDAIDYDFDNIINSCIRTTDIHLYIKAFLNIIDIINIYDILICYDRTTTIISHNTTTETESSQQMQVGDELPEITESQEMQDNVENEETSTFNSILKNKQILFSKKIIDLLSKLEFINYNVNTENAEFMLLDNYKKQIQQNNMLLDEINKFDSMLESFKTYMPSNINFDIEFDISYNYISISNKLLYEKYADLIMKDIFNINYVDLWINDSEKKNKIIKYIKKIINKHFIDNAKKSTKSTKSTKNKELINIDEKDIFSNINKKKNSKLIQDFDKIITDKPILGIIVSAGKKNKLYQINYKKISELFKILIIKIIVLSKTNNDYNIILKNIFYNIIFKNYYNKNNYISGNLIKIHNELIKPYITYNSYFKVLVKAQYSITDQTTTAAIKLHETQIIDKLKELYTFNIKKLKLKYQTNDNNFLTYNKYIQYSKNKKDEINNLIIQTYELINYIKFNNYVNMIKLYKDNKINLNIEIDIFNIYNNIYYQPTIDIILLKAFNYFIFSTYIKETYIKKKRTNDPNYTRFLQHFKFDNLKDFKFDNLKDINDINNNMILNYIINTNNTTTIYKITIKYEYIFDYIIEFSNNIIKKMKNAKTQEKSKLNDIIIYFNTFYEYLYLNELTIDNINIIKSTELNDDGEMGSDIYGYNSIHYKNLIEHFKNIVTSSSSRTMGQNINIISLGKRHPYKKDFIDNGISFLINEYSNGIFLKDIGNKITNRQLFKYISVNTFIITELLDILGSSDDNIFNIFKKYYIKYDTMRIKEIAVTYYTLFDNDKYNKYILDMLHVFLKNVVKFYDKMINIRKQSSDFNVRLYNATSSKDLKSILSKFDFIIKYTTSNIYPELKIDISKYME